MCHQKNTWIFIKQKIINQNSIVSDNILTGSLQEFEFISFYHANPKYINIESFCQDNIKLFNKLYHGLVQHKNISTHRICNFIYDLFRRKIQFNSVHVTVTFIYTISMTSFLSENKASTYSYISSTCVPLVTSGKKLIKYNEFLTHFQRTF